MVERMNRLTTKVFRSAAEQDRHNADEWSAVPVAERLREVWRMSEELWRLKGEFPDEPGLCRSVARVTRR